MAKTRVIVVDDSALVRSMLSEIINRQPDMECISAASDPFVAREMIRIFGSPEVFDKRIIVMAGDRGGLITFGNDLDEAADVLFQYYNKDQK
mgnify:CR=1 FL=1